MSLIPLLNLLRYKVQKKKLHHTIHYPLVLVSALYSAWSQLPTEDKTDKYFMSHESGPSIYSLDGLAEAYSKPSFPIP